MFLNAKRLYNASAVVLVSRPPAYHPSVQLRTYASEANPYRWPSGSHPTPYDILEIHKNAPYTKQRYIELVKIYHPDHHRHHSAICSRHVKLDRFNLIMSANAILSDKNKRFAYDRYGAGWNGPFPAPSCGHPYPVYHRNNPRQKWWQAQAREGYESTPSSDFYNAYGRGGYNDTSQNATWEDWERWHAARDAEICGKQQEIYTNNGVFLAIVVVLACVGLYAEVNYATGASSEIVKMSSRQTVDLSKDIMRRREDTIKSGNHEERVRHFLIMRDPVEARKFVGSASERNALPQPSGSTTDRSHN